MSKHLIEGFITYRAPHPWEKAPYITFSVWSPKDVGNNEAVIVCPHSFEVEVPDDFDPRPQQVAALQAEKQKVRADFAKRITDLDTQISKLLALTNEVAEA